MIRHKALKVRIHPSYHQREYIYMIFAARRKIYNYILEKNLKQISNSGVQRVGMGRIFGLLNISVNSIIQEYPWLKKVPKYILLEEKKKIDVALTEYALSITRGYITTPPKFHSQNAVITESYVDKTKFSYLCGISKHHHHTLNIPHLGYVEVLKPLNHAIIKLQKKYGGLIFGIDIRCINVKITHTSDDKFYAMLMFEFEDGVIEYQSKQHQWLKYQYNDKFGYDMNYYESHIVAIDDHVKGHHKPILCQDSCGDTIYIPKRVITLTHQTQLLYHKMNDIKSYSYDRRIVYLIRYKRKRMQLNNLIISLSHQLSNHYVYTCDATIIALSTHVHSRTHPFLKLYETFRKYLELKIQMEVPDKQITYISVPYNVCRRKTTNIAMYLKQNAIAYYMSLHL